jgi:hypothetical protein
MTVALVMIGMVPSVAAEHQPVRVGVQLSNAAGAPPWILAFAQELVAGVYERAGVEVVWEGQTEAAQADVQLTIILTRKLPVTSIKNGDVLAVAIAPPGGRGRLAYVVWPRVEAFAHAKRVPVARVLGRVIAHELGHLLLGHNAHSDEGIMRAQWNRADFAGIGNKAMFSPEQSARIREHITSASPVALAK